MNWEMITQQIQPTCIDDIVFAHQKYEQLIKNIVSNTHPFPMAGKNGILLYGPWGTGKTELAKMLPDAIERTRTSTPSYYRFDEITDGNNGAKLINRINAVADLMPAASFQYFVLDEVDLLTKTAMQSLKSVMNNKNAVFIMTTNKITAVDQGIINRCHLVPFDAAPALRWIPRAQKFLHLCGVTTISSSALLPIISQANGSARDIFSSLTNLVIQYRAQHGLPPIPA